ncbi:hypothetical protein SeMB42_g00744 [Synchytrium endobioticum]|uniref:LysM domain-containing protein n=1 Tax=Synchytrium endobioticum TaxID=286115 RepID=A0A507DRB9_9FUNG|nr:hypothetical protein SeMB42_g00744 [Synchytrium endobioticum]
MRIVSDVGSSFLLAASTIVVPMLALFVPITKELLGEKPNRFSGKASNERGEAGDFERGELMANDADDSKSDAGGINLDTALLDDQLSAVHLTLRGHGNRAFPFLSAARGRGSSIVPFRVDVWMVLVPSALVALRTNTRAAVCSGWYTRVRSDPKDTFLARTIKAVLPAKVTLRRNCDWIVANPARSRSRNPATTLPLPLLLLLLRVVPPIHFSYHWYCIHCESHHWASCLLVLLVGNRMDVPPLTPSAIATTEWISVTSSPLAGTDPLRLVALDPLSSNHNLHQAASQVPSSAASAPTQFSARLAAALKTEMASLDRPRPKTHQVTAHDTVESIAVKYGVSASDLKRINKIYDPSHIIVKSSVVIPSVQKRSSSGGSIHRKLRVWSASELLLRLEEDIPAISCGCMTGSAQPRQLAWTYHIQRHVNTVDTIRRPQ